MTRGIRDWVDRRTGYRRLLERWNSRTIPGGPRWRYVTGSCLILMLTVVAITGVLLMTTYSASSTNAWASVHYIDQMAGGSFIRGVHYYGSQALLVLLAVHTIRTLVEGLFRAPRELIFATGLLLFPLTLFWAVTGNPLGWTQRGYGQIQVETNILASTPLVGPIIQRVLIGGDELGHLTLTHLYSLHVAVFPLLAFLILGTHVWQVYRHGTHATSAPEQSTTAIPYWPYQSVRNYAAFAVMLSIVAVLAVWKGAPLDAPADPSLRSVPRPEWYFLFLFELRRYFSGDWEIVATLLIPLAALIILLAMPAIDQRLSRTTAAAFRLFVLGTALGGWSWLTYAAIARDWNDPEYQAVVAHSRELADRARQLASENGVPPEGAIALLRSDPKSRGPVLFAEQCAACHRYGNEFRTGNEAPDLAQFGSERWIQDLLNHSAGQRFFGQASLGQMKKWVDKTAKNLTPDERSELDAAAHWLAGHPRGVPAEDDESAFARGYAAFSNWCVDCHKYEGEGGTDLAGPDFTGYGSPDWIRSMLLAPNSADRYGKRSTMPSFAERLSDADVDLIVKWLTDSDRDPNSSTRLGRAMPHNRTAARMPTTRLP